MLELFKKNHWLYSLLLLPYSILLHIHGILHPNSFDINDGSLGFQVLFSWLYGSGTAEIIIKSIVVFFQAVLVNRIIINNRMSGNITLLPGLFYITLSAHNKELLSLSPALIAVTFVLLSFVELNKIYIRRPVPVYLYNFGIWSALAFVIYPPLSILFVVGILSIQIMRGLKLIEIFQMLGGYFTILFLFSTLFYYNGQLSEFWNGLFSFNPRYFYSLLIKNWINQIYYIFLFLLLLMALLSMNKINSHIGIKERKKWQIVIFILTGSLLAIVLQEQQMWQHWHLILLPNSHDSRCNCRQNETKHNIRGLFTLIVGSNSIFAF